MKTKSILIFIIISVQVHQVFSMKKNDSLEKSIISFRTSMSPVFTAYGIMRPDFSIEYRFKGIYGVESYAGLYKLPFYNKREDLGFVNVNGSFFGITLRRYISKEANLFFGLDMKHRRYDWLMNTQFENNGVLISKNFNSIMNSNNLSLVFGLALIEYKNFKLEVQGGVSVGFLSKISFDGITNDEITEIRLRRNLYPKKNIYLDGFINFKLVYSIGGGPN